MNTSRPRIEFSEPTFPLVCAFLIPSDRPSLKSASGSAGLRFSRSPVSPNPIPSSPGTGGSLPANLTAPNYVLRRAGPASRPKWKRSLCAWPEELRLGIRPHRRSPGKSRPPCFRSNCGKHPPSIRDSAGTQAEPEHNLEGFHRLSHGRPGRYRLLYSRSAHLARSCHLLCLVLHPSGISPCQSRRFEQTSNRRVDDSDGSQHHRRGFRIPPRHALPSSRSGYKMRL